MLGVWKGLGWFGFGWVAFHCTAMYCSILQHSGAVQCDAAQYIVSGCKYSVMNAFDANWLTWIN